MHQALTIGTTKGREGVVGLYLVAMGVVGAMACPDGAPKRQNSDHEFTAIWPTTTRIHNLAYHNGIMDFDIDLNAPGTAHWYHKRKGGRRRSLSGGHGGCWRHGAPRWGAQIRQNSDHEFTIWPTTMALWTLTLISTHQALPIGTTKGREGVVGLYLVAMGVVGAMACPAQMGRNIRQNSDHEFTIWPTTMALWTLTSIPTHQALPIGTTKGREGVVGLYLVAMGVVGAMARPDGAPNSPKFRPRIHNLAYHNGIMDFDIDPNAPGTAHWYHKRKGGRRRSLSGGHGGCWRHGAPRWGAKFAKIQTTNSQFGLPQWHYGL